MGYVEANIDPRMACLRARLNSDLACPNVFASSSSFFSLSSSHLVQQLAAHFLALTVPVRTQPFSGCPGTSQYTFLGEGDKTVAVPAPIIPTNCFTHAVINRYLGVFTALKLLVYKSCALDA